MLLSLILYGSRARGDHRLTSDVDLLGVTESGVINSEVAVRGASFYAYPSKKLIINAEHGDLFVSHLVNEGKILHDTLDFFNSVKSAFVYKDSYHEEIEIAHAVLYYLLGKSVLVSRKAVRKRLIWAIRTILISRAAERGKAVFSASDLADFAGYAKLKDIIDKRNVIDAKILFSAAEHVADEFGLESIHINFPAEKKSQEQFLLNLGGIAASTVELTKPFRFKSKARRSEPNVQAADEFYE